MTMSCDKRKWTNSLDPNNELPSLPAVVFNPAGGHYENAQTVTISCPNPNASIRYTTDGSMPDASSSIYYHPITVNASFTINAMAFAESGFNPGPIVTAGYVINDMVAMPSFDPPAGIYNTLQNVIISCNTPEATIRYTTNGTDPTASSAQYSTPLTMNNDTEIRAKAFKSGMNPSAINAAFYSITQTVTTPTFDPLPGAYNTAQAVSISCTTPGAQIRYSTDGSEPTEASLLYGSQLSISGNSTNLQAKAFKSGWIPSTIASGVYTVTQSVATPTCYPAGGSYNTPQSVTCECATAGATIRYTLNGSDPTSTSPVYSAPISITTSSSLRIKAFKAGMNPSSTTSAYYTITPICNIPVIHPDSGTYSASQSIWMTCATAGATIRYTLNGLDPNTSSPAYTNPITVSTNTTVKARAFKAGYATSSMASTWYNFTYPNVADPVVSPDGGTFNVSQIATLSCSTDGAEIRYTTNGLDPTSSSPLFIEPFTVKENSIVKAKAFKSGMNSSSIVSKQFFFRTYLQGWGRNDVGQNEVPTSADIIALAAGYYHCIAIREDRSLVGWGYYVDGEIDVPNGNNYIRVAAGYYHSLALRENGTLIAWGRNTEGQCDVPTGPGFVAIEAGNNYSLALRSDGQLFAWGSGAEGCLNTPGGVFTAISAGYNHCLAIRADGSIQAWGSNADGQCDVPTGTDFVAIAGGLQHSLALRNNGSLVAWGSNLTHQCEVPAGYTYISVGAGYGHSTAIKTDGTLVAWGRNEYHQCDVPPGQNFYRVESGFFNNIAQRSLGKRK